MNRINKWKIDINPNIKPIVPKTTIMQGDINSNSLTIEVYQDRKPLDLIGKCIVINFALPNKKTVVQTSQGTEKNIVLEGNKATLMLKNNIMLEVGTVLTAITITEDDTLLTTRSAEIEIIEAQQLGIIDETDPDLPILQSLIMQTQTLINQVEDIKVVESDRVLAEDERVANELLRQQLYNQLTTLQTQLTTLKTQLTDLESTVTSNEATRQLNEQGRITLSNELSGLQTILEGLQSQLTTDLADFRVDSQNAIDNFDNNGQLAITRFENVSQVKIDEFVTLSGQKIQELTDEIDRVQADYLAELNLKTDKTYVDTQDAALTTQLAETEQEIMSFKEDYANLVTEVNKKANKQQEAWITPTLLNGWTSISDEPVAYFKDNFGIVHLRGRCVNGTLNTSVFELPANYRPNKTCRLVQISDLIAGRVSIRPWGPVTVDNGSNTWTSLDGITFRTEV